METENKPHLIIPDSDVITSPRPIGYKRAKYRINHARHGAKLSKNLIHIRNSFDKLKSDSLKKEKIMIFQVALQKAEDFSAQKKFIEGEEMTINVVKDKRNAIVSIPEEKITYLETRVGRYQKENKKKDFKLIDKFEAFTSKDKKTPSLIEHMKEVDDKEPIDVEVTLLPQIHPDVLPLIKESIMEKLRKDSKKEVTSYELSDGTAIIGSSLTKRAINRIAKDSAVYMIKQTTYVHNEISASAIPLQKNAYEIDPDVQLDSLPIVVVLDNGVSLPEYLEKLVVEHWRAKNIGSTTKFGDHGTLVASRVMFADLGDQLNETYLRPRAKVIDALIADDRDKMPLDEIIPNIKEAVARFGEISKIFVLPYNGKTPISGSSISDLAYELDLLSWEHKVKFVISSGNHEVFTRLSNIDNIVKDPLSRIAMPAESIHGITVGAILGTTDSRCIGRENDVAPYSRVGPGFNDLMKPDLVAYGGAMLPNGKALFSDNHAVCFGSSGPTPDAGTSYTAPTVAGDLAEVSKAVPNEDLLLAEALLFNRAKFPVSWDDKSLDDRIHLSNLYGRGISSPKACMHSLENKVSFLYRGTIKKLTTQRIKFYIPEAIKENIKRGTEKLKITVTCLSHPKVDRSKPMDYIMSCVSASLHKLNENGVLRSDNPSGSEGRDDWAICHHFSKKISVFESGDWEVWLEGHSRHGNDEEIPYALVITVEDLQEENKLHSAIINETGNRYTVQTQWRAKVR